jgi:hypothetical protein
VSGSQRRAVFSIPKTLYCYFLYDLKLFADLSRCTCESLNVFLQKTIPENNPIPGAVTPKQTFGDFLGFNPHAQILATDGCFYGNKEMIRVDTPLELKKLETIFQYKVLGMLLSKEDDKGGNLVFEYDLRVELCYKIHPTVAVDSNIKINFPSVEYEV